MLIAFGESIGRFHQRRETQLGKANRTLNGRALDRQPGNTMAKKSKQGSSAKAPLSSEVNTLQMLMALIDQAAIPDPRRISIGRRR